MEGVKLWLILQVADFFGTGIQNLFHDKTRASILAVASSELA
jgi:hypothetical protein